MKSLDTTEAKDQISTKINRKTHKNQLNLNIKLKSHKKKVVKKQNTKVGRQRDEHTNLASRSNHKKHINEPTNLHNIRQLISEEIRELGQIQKKGKGVVTTKKKREREREIVFREERRESQEQ